MEFLARPNVSPYYASRSYFDLKENNERLNVIVPMEEDVTQKFEEVFQEIIFSEKNDVGYYYLKNLLNYAQMVQPDIVVSLIVKSIDQQILPIQQSVYRNPGELYHDITLAMYIQLWQTYQKFALRIYYLIKYYQHYLIDKKIRSGKIYCDILSILQICMFYNNIIDKSKDNILLKISEDISKVDQNNIEQLVNYIDSIRAFMVMKDFIDVDYQKLFNLVKSIINKPGIINMMCSYLHCLFKDLVHQSKHSTEYQTAVANDSEKEVKKKIHKITAILSTYGEKDMVLICYRKFMQARIIDLSYDHLELEIDNIKRLSTLFGKKDAQNLLNAIADIINCKNINQSIQNADIKIKSDEYQHLNEISNKILNPIILTKTNWKIYNTSNLEPRYPLELKCYLDIVSKSYIHLTENKNFIQWQPTLGCAQFEAQLGLKRVNITCNVLQAIALIYLNEHPQTTVSKFASDTLINEELATKIFESLYEANLVIYFSENDADPFYSVNTNNYAGDLRLDIRRTFVETFETEQTIAPPTTQEPADITPDPPVEAKPMKYREFYEMKLEELRKEHPHVKNLDKDKKIRMVIIQAWKEYESKNLLQKISHLIPEPKKKQYGSDSEHTECSPLQKKKQHSFGSCSEDDLPKPNTKYLGSCSGSDSD